MFIYRGVDGPRFSAGVLTDGYYPSDVIIKFCIGNMENVFYNGCSFAINGIVIEYGALSPQEMAYQISQSKD